MKKLASIPLLVIILFCMSYGYGQADVAVIEQLTKEIAQAQTDAQKSRLHMFRARNYNNAGNREKAEEDYDAALAYDHKGWIHLERARFYLALEDYHQVKKEAVAAQKETSTLKNTAQKLITIADRRIENQQGANEQKEIYLTKRWEAHYSRQRTGLVTGRPSVRSTYAARASKRPKRVARS